MNAVTLFKDLSRTRQNEMALMIPGETSIQFGELTNLSVRMQKLFLLNKLKPGETVLVLAPLFPHLYAAIIALLSMGITLIFVEPWMKMSKLNNLVAATHARCFIYQGLLPWLWGHRASALRKIPNWISLREADGQFLQANEQLHVENVSPDLAGMITFTTGTTGSPKGVVRAHGYLESQYQVFAKNLDLEKYQGPDLCIFANFALANLTSGRGSILIPSSWNSKYLRRIDQLPPVLQPETLTCGPAFLLEVFKYSKLNALKSLHVGGAQTDNWIFEKAFAQWPEAKIHHIYGASEAEPVAIADAREAVLLSQRKNLFQTLYLGKPVDSIQSEIVENSLWVSGPHVCPEYWGGHLAPENLQFKKRIKDQTWHNMGDRITSDDGWWYAGRSVMDPKTFELEQKIYFFLQRSDSFIVTTENHFQILVGQKLLTQQEEILRAFPELHRIHEIKIYRDDRHRSRIDRKKSILKGLPWLLGSNS